MAVTSPLLPLTIALGAVAADGGGLHRLAFYLVLLAIPAAAATALAAAGDLAEGRQVTVRICWTAAALGLLVISSAARANAPEGAAVPAIAISALVASIVAYVSIAVAWLLRPERPAQPVTAAGAQRAPAVEPAPESRAA